MRLVTQRLVLSDVEPDDVDALLAVARSNPGFLATHEGSDGEPGHFDRGMLERDLGVADLDAGRHPLTVRRTSGPRTGSHTDGPHSELVVGWAELLDEHPRDGVPWIGLLLLHSDHQRQGLGRECVQAFVTWARERGAPALRLGVDDGNDGAAAFWRSQGFGLIDRRERPSPLGRLGVDVLELAL